jgi:hypothetical protein
MAMNRSVVLNEGQSKFLREVQGKQPRDLLKTFWLVVAMLAVLIFFFAQSSAFESILAACFIIVAGLIPSYLWCSGKALGLPLYPIFALSYLWTYALPLITRHPGVVEYPLESHLLAGATVAGFLLLGTLVWFLFVRTPVKSPKSYRRLEGSASSAFFLIALFANTLFTMGMMGGWLNIEASLLPLLRGTIGGFSSLAIFVLSYFWGKKELSKNNLIFFVLLLALLIISSAASLLIVGALSMFFLAAVGFIFGRRRVPWVALSVIFICLTLLHSGKGAMRDKYFYKDGQSELVQPWQYPAWFTEWVGYSTESFLDTDSDGYTNTKRTTFAERVGLIHLLLLAQDKTPKEVSYMMGETYTIIPELLVPRFILPNKPASHEGTSLLNIHFGKQTREDIEKTTIGWGLLNESYANFGLFGCAGLAVIYGLGYGWVTRWSLNTPILSSRSLFAVLVLSFTFQSEFTAGVFITTLFQSTVPLIALTFLLMKVHRVEKQLLS